MSAAHRAHAKLGGIKRQQGALPAEEEIPAADLKTIDGGIAAMERIYESLRRNPSNRALGRSRTLTNVVTQASPYFASTTWSAASPCWRRWMPRRDVLARLGA